LEDGVHAEHRGTLPDYLAVLRRRKWLVLEAILLAPLAALFFSLNQQRLYEASAEVLLSRENLATSLTGAVDPSFNQQADRIAETQARLARVPAVVQSTLDAAGVEMTVKDFLESSSVTARANADLLLFQVTHEDPATARRLATEYARQFTLYRRELDTAAIAGARREVQERIDELEASNAERTPLYRSLVEKDQQLATMEALRTSNASVVRPAGETEQVQPRVVRNVLLGLLLGLGLGIGLAFLWEALDTRVRSADDVTSRLDLPLLARIPEAPRKLRANDRLVMVEEPDGVQAESFRMLRTNLDFVRMERSARTIMVTSAIEQEGKSTTVSNLAVALARSGKRVVLVDLDLRRPYIDRFFDLEGAWGVTQVALGHVSLDEALTPLSLAPAPRQRRSRFGRREEETAHESNGHGHGALLVLPSGPLPPNPGEFVASKAVDDILIRLRGQADIVLVDAPPLLHVGDALTLSAKVEALIVVTRINVLRKRMLDEVRRLLSGVPAEKLGYVLTGAGAEQGYYGGSYDYGRGAERKPKTAPVS
jgi:Mrp family chromosome partitioning ATPase/capsular polysaccharide biosynthesis protein